MDSIIQGISKFRESVFPVQRQIYEQFAREGQNPSALIIACADSRVAPEHFTQTGPGQLFVCRNVGNIVPPFIDANGSVASAIEYAIEALKVRDIIICGHSECGAMKGLRDPETLVALPSVTAWLKHSQAARKIVCEAYPADMDPKDRHRALALENVVVQLGNLRTHPSVAARLATGHLRLHGWFFDIETGTVLAYDGETGGFKSIEGNTKIAVAQAPAVRVAAPEIARAMSVAAE